MKPDYETCDVAVIQGSTPGHEVDETRVQRVAKLCERARSAGYKCDACHARLAVTLRTNQLDDTLTFLCANCNARSAPTRPTNTADVAAMENYLRSKGID